MLRNGFTKTLHILYCNIDHGIAKANPKKRKKERNASLRKIKIEK